MLFAHVKRHLTLDRLRMREMNGARDEILLAATIQALRRMAWLLSRPSPIQGGQPRLREVNAPRFATADCHPAQMMYRARKRLPLHLHKKDCAVFFTQFFNMIRCSWALAAPRHGAKAPRSRPRGIVR